MGLNPGQNYDHLLDPISGYDGMHDLQFHGYLEPAVAFHRGALLRLETGTGLLTPGLPVVGHHMGLWAINASYDFDVAGGQDWSAGSPPLYRSDSGNIAGQTLAADNITVQRRHVATFVATGGYELVTTEFDPAVAYAENDPLIGYLDAVTGAEPAGSFPEGWVTIGTGAGNGALPLALAENVVGVVSRVNLAAASGGIREEVYNQPVIQFWPVYLPARA